MRASLKKSARWLRTGSFWVAVVLVLPNCSVIFRPGEPDDLSANLRRGSLPHSSAIFCDIERKDSRRCASAADLIAGIPRHEAALALNEGRTSNIALDYSPAALEACDGRPQAVEVLGAFPEGTPVCLNCGVIGSGETYETTDAACRAHCYDFFGTVAGDGTIAPDVPPSDETRTFCDGAARASTNSAISSCFAGACSNEGALLPTFVDPRRLPQAVGWRDFIGTTAGVLENDLTRTAPATGDYDAGAVSSQWIRRGDAYVEFGVGRDDQSHFLGFSTVPEGCPVPEFCPDTDPGFMTIGFAIMLHADAHFYVSESGAGIPGPDFNESWGVYSASDRFRVRLRDNGDGTAAVEYSKLVGSCVTGTPCNQTVFLTRAGRTLRYPVRVDASLREAGGTLRDVRLVYAR